MIVIYWITKLILCVYSVTKERIVCLNQIVNKHLFKIPTSATISRKRIAQGRQVDNCNNVEARNNDHSEFMGSAVHASEALWEEPVARNRGRRLGTFNLKLKYMQTKPALRDPTCSQFRGGQTSACVQLCRSTSNTKNYEGYALIRLLRTAREVLV